MELLDQDVISLDEVPFLAQRVMVRLENSVLLYQRTTHRLRTYTKVEPNWIALLITGPRARATMDGIRMRPEHLVVGAPGAAVELVVDAGYSSVTLLIPPEDFLEHLSVRGRSAEFRIPDGAEHLTTSGLETRAFYDLGKRLADRARHRPDLFNDNQSARISANMEVLETILATLGPAQSFKPTREDQRNQNYSQIIKTVEAFLSREVDSRLYVSDLCRVAGVSERTLQYAFNEVLGTTPMAYMKLLKLHRVRAELRAASRATTTVSSAALNWGFWHFGEFSRDYKKCFNELPSETLKRQSSSD